ncbi:MAG: UDP-N-acetylmuramoyl-tripeptide--D-alanyl-D-alanine ligase [Actinomycetia bacterium]|nr:UDP-N-acetylmuramoyl-tripeptide--D-alanyl-D-alanine ligase [Actinomycetes bacterium]
MLATIAALYALALLCALLLPDPLRLEMMALLVALTFLIPLLANALNTPVEHAIRRHYLADAQRVLAASPRLTVIGITGSYGKTSVKHFLTALLQAKYHVLMTPESYNTPMGVVMTIREQLRSTHEIFVCEMGARYEGDIRELCDLVNPTHGVITAIGEQHLETMGSLETITRTKFELAGAVAGKGMLFLNGDNETIRANLPEGQAYRTYGLSPENDYCAFNIETSQSGTTFSLRGGGETACGLKTQLIGEHNVVNLAGALALAHYLGVPYDEMRLALRRIAAVPHRLQLIQNAQATIIDDAYNSNPSGCEAALETLALFDGCKILITPGMVELGSEQDARNRVFGEQAAAVCDQVILVGEKQTRAIFAGMTDAGFDPSKIVIAHSFTDAIREAYALTTDQHKVILLENDLPDNY